MKSLSLLRPLGVVLPLFFATACSQTPPTQTRGDARIDRVDREFDIADGITRIAIDNPWGEINVRGPRRARGRHPRGDPASSARIS